MHAAIIPRGFAPPNRRPGRVHTVGGRVTYREISRHVPLVSDYIHICFFLDLLLQLILKLLLLSRSAHGHAVRLKIPHPLRTARVPKIILPFGCCNLKTTLSPRHHLQDLPSLQPRPPPVIRPCPPAMWTCTSRVLSHPTFVDVAARSLASETSLHYRNLRFPGSTV